MESVCCLWGTLDAARRQPWLDFGIKAALDRETAAWKYAYEILLEIA